VSDFRGRVHRQLSVASRRLAASTSRQDLRARLGAQLTVAATALAARDGDMRVRFGIQLGAAAGALAGAHAGSDPRVPRRARARAGSAPIPRRAAHPIAALGAHRLRLRHPVAVGLALVAFAGAATAATIWLPELGNPDFSYSPGVETAAPPADQLAALGVLRRPQTEADRSGSEAALHDVNEFATGVRTAYVRVLGSTANGPAVLVPVASRTGAPGLAGRRDALCLYYPVVGAAPNGAGTNAAPACWSTQQVSLGKAWASSTDHIFGLVPDGVTSVTVTNGDASAQGTVSSNFFDVVVPGVTAGSPPPPPGVVHVTLGPS
jgi:hypothetical protein